MDTKTSTSRLQKFIVLVVVIVPLLATVFAIKLLWDRAVGWNEIILLVVAYTITAFGVTVGFHRMLTHRAFETYPAIRAVLLIAGAMALEGSPLRWAADHLKHHAHADQDGDPHSPVLGFFHAHVGWLLRDGDRADPAVYCRSLMADPMVMFVTRTYVVWAVLGLVLPYLAYGWRGFLWAGLVRVFLTHHVTWSVNSVCHIFGSRPFPTRDRSTNQWLVGVLAMGEGWHNNHHAFPRSAFHGLRWWEIDMSGLLIGTLERARLAWRVYRVPAAQIDRRRGLVPLPVEAGSQSAGDLAG